jgi:steroid delta-isomerase-like uncharacterized protein
MSAENKTLARRYFQEVLSKGKLDLVDELAAPDLIGHPSGFEEQIRGPEGMKEFVARLREAFPDLTMTVEDQLAEGNTVVTRWTARATHDGEFVGIDPTGRTGTVTGITIQRIRDGKFVEGWTNWDMLGLLQQLGVALQPTRA